jgi:hypothetical protein
MNLDAAEIVVGMKSGGSKGRKVLYYLIKRNVDLSVLVGTKMESNGGSKNQS